jgi:pimeloyl-ACP methyl ester carboxylesterase
MIRAKLKKAHSGINPLRQLSDGGQITPEEFPWNNPRFQPGVSQPGVIQPGVIQPGAANLWLSSRKKHSNLLNLLLLSYIFFASLGACSVTNEKLLVIREQGSFAVGGTVITNPGTFDPYHPTPEGQTFHGDHARVFYQIPDDARKYPLVMWHGMGQFSKTWETTPDGREGFQNIFLRRQFPVYLIDQPRRGSAGRSTVTASIIPVPDEQQWFGMFRIGIWPDYFEGVQFSRDQATLNQYFRSMTPSIGAIDIEVNADAVSALFSKIGPGILVTHSHSGGMGWRTAIRNQLVKAIVSFEPGSGFLFPEGEVPPPMLSSGGTLEAVAVSMQEFRQLTKIPIILYYGDFIPGDPSPNPGQDSWRVRLEMARLWKEAVNRHGGDVTLVHLPEIGIKGNTHFPFSDLNNLEIADLLSAWLKDKGLD